MRGARDDRRIEVLDERALERIDGQAPVDRADGHAHRGQLHGRQRAATGGRRFLDDLHLNGARATDLIEPGNHTIAKLAGTSFQMGLRQRKHTEHRNITVGNIGAVHVDTQRGLERRERQLARTQSAHERMCAAGLDQIATTHDNARLCGTEQFIARARHQIEPCRNRSRRGFFAAAHQDVVGQQRARALVLVEQQAMLVSKRRKLPRAHLLVKALDAIVGRMDLEDHGRIGRDGALVVRQVRAVGGADLDEFGARSRHDIRNTEAATDLDELATAHDDLFARGMSRQH